MKNVIELLVTSYETCKEQFKAVISSINEDNLLDFMYVSKSNKENIVVVLKNQLDKSELAKYTDSITKAGFSLSYNNNLDDNGQPKKYISKQDNSVKNSQPMLTLHKASNSIEDFMNA
tara:strand:- start:320 stop:673 length:354 start_codon:yes stop_codon:yes gene_type:complete